MYNRYINEGIFPDELKVGKISPIYKKESEELLENYRPVSTLAIFGKIFEKVMFARSLYTRYPIVARRAWPAGCVARAKVSCIQARLHSFLTSQNLLYEHRYGFRKYHSTSHAINYSVNHVESCLTQKNMFLIYLLISMKHKIFNETQNFNSHFFIIIIVNI